MPSTVADIFAASGATTGGVVPWGTRPLAASGTGPATGLYVIALTDDPGTVSGAIPAAPIDPVAVEELLAVRPELRLDGIRPTPEQRIARLAGFWFPDEVVVYVYIGLAGARKTPSASGELAQRVGEYYTTPLGARSPHAGGWPLNVLSCLQDLCVHYGYCGDVVAAERLTIGHFAADHVSDTTRAVSHDAARLMPFANLEFPRVLIGDRLFRHILVVPPVGSRQRAEVIAYAAERGIELLEWPAVVEGMLAGITVRKSARNQTDHVLRILLAHGFVEAPGGSEADA